MTRKVAMKREAIPSFLENGKPVISFDHRVTGLLYVSVSQRSSCTYLRSCHVARSNGLTATEVLLRNTCVASMSPFKVETGFSVFEMSRHLELHCKVASRRFKTF